MKPNSRMEEPTRPFAALQPFIPIGSVVKRNGSVCEFDPNRIAMALCAAGRATGEYSEIVAQSLSLRVIAALQFMNESQLPVERIQDLVEEVLLASPYKKTARAYILYRDQHQTLRILEERAQSDLVDNYLSRLDWKVKENSNMSYSLQGLNHYISSEVSSNYWLARIYSEEVRNAHNRGDMHIHDLNLLSVYCVGWDLADILRRGFTGASGKAASAPPRHLQSALGQIVNFFYTLQGEAAGAQALSSFDTYLAPFVREDRLDALQLKSAISGFVFNLNVPTRVGFQTPFTNIALDLVPPPSLKNEHVIIGGQLREEKYGDYQMEMNLINRALFEVLAEGDADGRVFTFPIPTINIDANFDWDNPFLDSMWEATARYGIPYFANFVNSEMKMEDTRSMCCRLRLDTQKLQKRSGGLFGANPLTGSIGVVTINLPRIGQTAECKNEFLQILEQKMAVAVESLEQKRKVLERFTTANFYPYSTYYLQDVFNRFGSYWYNHFSTVGIIGMNEACMNMLGEGIHSAGGKRFALEVLDIMRNYLEEVQATTGNFYNLEATPAEGASFRLAALDGHRDKNGNITLYTNSTALPVDSNADIGEVIAHQNELQSKYTGGTVLHVFTGEAASCPSSVKSFIRRVCATCTLPYFTISPTFSICPTHGYRSGRFDTCPSCNRACEVYSRVVGYLRPVSSWNEGKAAEFERRTIFNLEALS